MLDIGDGEAVKPFIPLLTKMPLDTDEIQLLSHECAIFLVLRTAWFLKEQVKRCSSIVMRFTCMPVTDLLTVYAHQNEKSWHLSCIERCIVIRVHTTPSFRKYVLSVQASGGGIMLLK
jgi:hypothetical protein